VIIVYGCTALVLEQTPGGRENAKMVSKGSFECLSLKHANDNFFLRPDFILAVFQVDHSIHLKMNRRTVALLDKERQCDAESVTSLEECSKCAKTNSNRISGAILSIRKGFLEIPMLEVVNPSAVNSNDEDESSNNTNIAGAGAGAGSMDTSAVVRMSSSSTTTTPEFSSRLPSRQGSKLIEMGKIGTSLDKVELPPDGQAEAPH
jgi:hypothetical protein